MSRDNVPDMIPIWFFIGLTVLVYGTVIAATGLFLWNVNAASTDARQLHLDFWWGTSMMAFGLLGVLANRRHHRR